MARTSRCNGLRCSASGREGIERRACPQPPRRAHVSGRQSAPIPRAEISPGRRREGRACSRTLVATGCKISWPNGCAMRSIRSAAWTRAAEMNELRSLAGRQGSRWRPQPRRVGPIPPRSVQRVAVLSIGAGMGLRRSCLSATAALSPSVGPPIGSVPSCRNIARQAARGPCLLAHAQCNGLQNSAPNGRAMKSIRTAARTRACEINELRSRPGLLTSQWRPQP